MAHLRYVWFNFARNHNLVHLTLQAKTYFSRTDTEGAPNPSNLNITIWRVGFGGTLKEVINVSELGPPSVVDIEL